MQTCYSSASRLPVFKPRKMPLPCNFDYRQTGRDWGETFHDCKNGCKQSPIDLPGPNPIVKPEMEIKLKGYKDVKQPGIVQMSYGWLGVEIHHGEMNVTFPHGDDDTYIPLNFHFHAPSDHTIRGKNFDLEMHIVHVRKSNKELGAVLTIPFDTKLGGNLQHEFIESLSPEKLNNDSEFIIIDKEYMTGYYESSH